MAVIDRHGVTFYYSDRGHLAGCDDPNFDLAPEHARIRKAAFERDMATAIDTGESCERRSSSPLDTDVQLAVFAVSRDPSPQNIWRAQWAIDESGAAIIEWERGIAEQANCGCPEHLNEDDPEDVHTEQIHAADCQARS